MYFETVDCGLNKANISGDVIAAFQNDDVARHDLLGRDSFQLPSPPYSRGTGAKPA